MPKALFYQPSSGISGDMHLGAMVDLGVPEDWLRAELNKLPVTAEFTLSLQPASKMGIAGTQARVSTTDSHDHRHHSTIVKMIREAGFAPRVEQRTLDIFQTIAVAEGKIHDISIDRVHFHEVGAVDSIVDIVGAALCIEYFDAEIILCNPIEVGSGHVDCAHGRFPVPAPATQEILSGAPCTYGGVQGESTTPTGAAILGTSVHTFSPTGSFTPHKVGYGIGHKDFAVPNVLRVALGEYTNTVDTHNNDTKVQYKLEANIDDMSPEAYEPLLAALFSAGAVDAYVMPIMMKKNRPANCVVALADAEHKLAVQDVILNQSTTIGLRILPFEKIELPRHNRVFTTSLGTVNVKVVTQPNGQTRWKSEHADILKISAALNRDYPSVKQIIDRELAEHLHPPPTAPD